MRLLSKCWLTEMMRKSCWDLGFIFKKRIINPALSNYSGKLSLNKCFSLSYVLYGSQKVMIETTNCPANCAQHSTQEDECQQQLARDSTNHKDILCSSRASDSPATSTWKASPKEAQFSPQLNMLHTPVNAEVTIPLSWTTYGFLDKGGFLKVWPAITSMKQILKQAWTNTADSEAHLEGTGQQVEVAQENHSRGQCTNPVITWAAASPTKGQASCLAGVIDWLRQQ